MLCSKRLIPPNFDTTPEPVEMEDLKSGIKDTKDSKDIEANNHTNSNNLQHSDAEDPEETVNFLPNKKTVTIVAQKQ